MKIDNNIITCFSEWDGLPIKNKLPEELKCRLKTEIQWIEEGFVVKSTSMVYEMHPSVMAKRTFKYYLDKDVEPITADNNFKSCLTCGIRSGRFCEVAGDWVGLKNCCSEWTSL